MSITDIFIIAAVLLGLAAALLRIRAAGKKEKCTGCGGRCGYCSGCSRSSAADSSGRKQGGILRHGS